MSTLLVTLIGSAGALCVLLGFAGQATRRLSSDAAAYHALNAVGGGAMVLSGSAAGAWPSAVVNAIWAVISLLWLLTLVRSRRRGPVTFEPPTAELAPPTREYALPTAELRLPTGEYAV